MQADPPPWYPNPALNRSKKCLKLVHSAVGQHLEKGYLLITPFSRSSRVQALSMPDLHFYYHEANAQPEFRLDCV